MMSDRDATPGREPAPEDILARARRLVYRLIGPNDALEDLVQTSVEQFLVSRHRHSGEGSIEAFADGITVNVIRGFMRRQRTTALVGRLVAVKEQWDSPPPGPAEEAASRDRLRRLMEILEQLRPAHRTAYLLYNVDGRTVAEIAMLEGTTESAVRTRILRARRDIHARARHDPVLAEWLGPHREDG